MFTQLSVQNMGKTIPNFTNGYKRLVLVYGKPKHERMKEKNKKWKRRKHGKGKTV